MKNQLTGQTPQGVLISPDVLTKGEIALYMLTWSASPEPPAPAITDRSTFPSYIKVFNIVSISSIDNATYNQVLQLKY